MNDPALPVRQGGPGPEGGARALDSPAGWGPAVRARSGLVGPDGRAAGVPLRHRWWIPVVLFVGIGALVWLVVGLSAAHLPRTERYPRPEHFPGGPVIEGWARWDGHWYRTIVREGYSYDPGVQSSVAFFPAYPLAVAALSTVVRSVWVAGVLVTAGSGLVAAVAFHRWCGRWLSPSAAATSVAVLLLYPYAWYLYGAVYADALCLAAMLVAFVAVERDRVWLAGLAGAVASGARPVGAVVAVALVARLVERRNVERGRVAPGAPFTVGLVRRFSPRGLRCTDLPVLLSVTGFAGYCTYLWVRFGDPVAFATVQSAPGWDQGEGWATWTKRFLVEQLVTEPHSPFVWAKVAQGLLALGMLALLPRIARRFGWAYAVLTLGVVLLPLVGTKDFVGTGRYLLAAFPCAAVAGEWLDGRPRTRVVVLAASGLTLAFLASAFGRGHYLA